MDDCCTPPSRNAPTSECPTCGTPGKAVKVITLKALLVPQALATLAPRESYRFCPEAGCEVVYFGNSGVYRQADVKVPVYQKDPGPEVPVCYCFGHPRAELTRALETGGGPLLERSIREHIAAGRCGCEVNNPQGSCCLGNVVTALRPGNRPIRSLEETVGGHP